MRLRVEDMSGGLRGRGSLLLCVAILAWCGLAVASARAADVPPPGLGFPVHRNVSPGEDDR